MSYKNVLNALEIADRIEVQVTTIASLYKVRHVIGVNAPDMVRQQIGLLRQLGRAQQRLRTHNILVTNITHFYTGRNL